MASASDGVSPSPPGGGGSPDLQSQKWGDPLHVYEHAGLSERWFMHPVFIVYYGVHEASRQVFVRDVRLNPYSPLAEHDPQG
jgi:hypothetical protein